MNTRNSLQYDTELFSTIQDIKAIDHHSHALPARIPEPDEGERPNPLGSVPFSYPVRLRVSNPEYIDAWRALYGYMYEDMTVDHAREALKEKLRQMDQLGQKYPEWVLDQAAIEMMFVNMPNLGSGQTGPRFRWVVYSDGLLSPFADVYAMGVKINPDAKSSSLDTYLIDVVLRQLQEWKAAGAVAIKFGIAYHRALDVADVPISEAQKIYAGCNDNGTKPSVDENKKLQDYLFHAISKQAGDLELAVHIHTGIGADPYFNLSGSNPLLLESVFNDVHLRHTNFVMLHGGWPFEREAGVMLMKPNVYADFSSQTFLRSTQALSRVLQAWLEWYPEKVLFGTDAYPDDTPLANWEEKLWLTTRSSREALTMALSRMMWEGQINMTRAEELARMVLRENAESLYKNLYKS